MTKSKSFRFIAVIIIAIAVLYGINKIGKQENYPLFKVNRGEFLIDVYADGIVQAGSSTIVNSPSRIWGNVRIIRMVDEGTYVEKGDFLLQFDTAEFEERVQNVQNELDKAEAAYESQMANIEKTRADLESQLKIEEYSLEQTRLRAKNAKYEAENKRKEIEYSLKKAEISYNQLVEKIEKNKEINAAALRQAELKINQAKMNLQRAKDDMAKLTITAPSEGLVVYKKIWNPNGREKIKVGSTPYRSQPLMEIPEKSNMKVMLNVNEVNISSIDTAQKVNLEIDALPEKAFTGVITNIASLAHEDENSGKKVFEVEVKISEVFEELRPGMSADCQIIVEQLNDVISIPIDAVTNRDGKIGVYNAGGKFIPVKTGKVSSDLMVIEEGLKAGDEIRLIKSQNTESGKSKNKSERQRTDSGRSEQVIIRG